MLVGRLASYHAATTPEALAVIDGRRQLTYRQLNERVNRLANALHGLGLRPGDRAAILARNSLEFVEAYLAYAKLGLVTVALNYRWAAQELAYALNDSEARALVLAAEFGAAVAEVAGELEHARHLFIVGAADLAGARDYEQTLSQASPVEPPELPLSPGDTQLILYTSGTTGFPKGAMLSHANQFWSSFNVRAYHPCGPGDRALCALPLCHTASLHMSLFPHLHAGAAVVLQAAFEPQATLRLIGETGCTSAVLLPQMWETLAVLPLGSCRLRLRQMIVGGGPTDPAAVERLRRVTGGSYSLIMGMTEVGPQLTCLPSRDVVRKNGSIGKPTLHVDVRVVREDFSEAAPDEVGEMVVRGPSVFAGYWNKPEATRESFTRGWFHSGDLVRTDDEGFLSIVDRKKDMIRSGGENIYSLEVERVLNRHPAVAESAVIGVPDPQWGESVKAYVVLRPGFQAAGEELVDWCRRHLASYKKPRFVTFVDRLPRNATGKILKGGLRRQAQAERATR